MNIRFVKGEDIEKSKWNGCVHYASNGNVFGYMWYLNCLHKEWDALVEDDYESVMPLIGRNRILRSRELFVPDLIRSTGIYSVNVLSPKRVGAFLDMIPKEYGKVQIHFNEGTKFPTDHAFKNNNFQNWFLLLNTNYDTLFEKYAPEVFQQLESASKHQLLPVSNLKPEKVADFYKQHTRQRKNLEFRFHALQRIMYNALHRGWGFSSGVSDKEGNLLAVGFFIFSHGGIMSLVSLASKKGTKLGALTYLIDLFIQNNAQRPLILDFNTEKSDWPQELPKQLGAREAELFSIKK